MSATKISNPGCIPPYALAYLDERHMFYQMNTDGVRVWPEPPKGKGLQVERPRRPSASDFDSFVAFAQAMHEYHRIQE